MVASSLYHITEADMGSNWSAVLHHPSNMGTAQLSVHVPSHRHIEDSGNNISCEITVL